MSCTLLTSASTLLSSTPLNKCRCITHPSYCHSHTLLIVTMTTYYFGGYIVRLRALEKMALDRTGKTVPIAEGIDYYVMLMKQALEPPNDLGEGYDVIFHDTQVVPVKGPDGKAEAGVLLVRGDTDDFESPYLAETAGDKLVKKMVEECLGVELSKFEVYTMQCNAFW